jgi:hypothetical protein
MNRRDFLLSTTQQLALGTIGTQLIGGARVGESERRSASPELVNRRARVGRHAPVVRRFDPLSPLSVGNGAFVFTADATGLQTFTDEYREIPLATQAEWGWHSFPNVSGYTLDDALLPFDAHGRAVSYASAQNSAAGTWLRENPHRLSLASIGLALTVRDGSPATPAHVIDIEQRLDLWSGTLESSFTFDGRQTRVRTCVHPSRDLIAVRIESSALDAVWLALRIAFPYASATHTGDPADWSSADKHHTEIVERDRTSVMWKRTLDSTTYWSRAAWTEGGVLRTTGPHEFRIAHAAGSTSFEFSVSFSAQPDTLALPTVTETLAACAEHWRRFWSDGGTLDLSGSADARAPELERRIVLSEYLTAIQCAGTMPPQETGETFNSWFGKSHLEMHWWHAAHFALWGRSALFERSLPWYQRILPAAQATARRQGYRGARWPKMVGPDGRESPSEIGVFLIWQQPHIIYLAELVYRATGDARVLQRYRELVFESAEFMASYAVWDAVGKRYVLGPPLIPAQEIHPAASTFNPTFELAYWEFGLATAQRWRERLGTAREPAWDRVLRSLSALPMRDGLYVNAESAPDTFTDATQRRDHPTLLGAYGFVGSSRVDRRAMRRTLTRVLERWDWSTTWGWDYPLVAMTAARLGEPELAVDALLMDTPKNRYLANGHNYQRAGLSIYLPGNGGLLSATAMMAAGWGGASAAPSPGFPRARWTMRAESLRPLLRDVLLPDSMR